MMRQCRRASGEGRRLGIEGRILRRLILSVMVTTLAIAASGAIAQTSSGTSFAVAPELLVTNQHVVAGCSSVEVISADGRRKGSVVVADADIDLAVLRVSGLKGPTARLRNPRAVRLGESVMVFGFPLAGALSSGGNFTSGLVSALRGLRDAAGELQITAPVQPGNSGGPLMDASGLVIGVVQRKLDALRAARATGDIPQNVNFAISLEVLASFLAKNRVAFHDAAFAAPLETEQVAAMAKGFTYRVVCLGRSQQARTSSGIEPRRLPQCPGSYAETWTNCVGEATRPDGAKYVDEYKDGKENGQGTETFSDGGKHVGEFRDGQPNGIGTSTFPDGGKYVGEYKDGMFHGQGTITLADGGKHVGEWRDGRRNGKGAQTLRNGSKYVGEFKDGKLNGQGTATLSNGEKYVGEFKDGDFSGQGVLTSPDGTRHVGDFRDGLPNGQGTFTLPNGVKYVGEHKDGLSHGKGTLYRANGSVLQSGTWENGVFVRGQ